MFLETLARLVFNFPNFLTSCHSLSTSCPVLEPLLEDYLSRTRSRNNENSKGTLFVPGNLQFRYPNFRGNHQKFKLS